MNLKNFFKFSCTFLFFYILSSASCYPEELGYCGRLKVRLTLKSNKTVEGYTNLTAGTLDKLTSYNDSGILQELKKNSRITLYTKLQTVNYPDLYPADEYKFTVCADSDKLVIDTGQITKAEKLELTSCETGIFPEMLKYRIHYTSEVIDTLTQKEIDTLQGKPFSETMVGFFAPYDNKRHNYACLNYNKDISETQLKQLCSPDTFFFKFDNKTSNEAMRIKQEQYFAELKRDLNKKNIIIVPIPLDL
ncbi:MAG: hypothetical protein JXJ19_02025 [Elusimicrobia bacterium]|nr:hypothetical protein [Elusimicrobiota bacterium]